MYFIHKNLLNILKSKKTLYILLNTALFFVRIGCAQPPQNPSPLLPNETGVVAEPDGAIRLEVSSPDKTIKTTLERLLSNYPNIREVAVHADQGVVELDGWVKDSDTRSRVTDFTRRVEGVKLVVNRMKLDSEVLNATQVVKQKYRQYQTLFARNWLLLLIALAVILFASFLGRQIRIYSEVLLLPFVPNGLLRSVIGSLISPLVLFLGIILALSVLNLTQTVASMLGLAGVVGLALGFAFRDIAENFIASMLLGLRPPFLIGDLITIGNHTGTVKTLNTRATVLVTAEGNHVRIPNATVFKEVVINRTASKRQRAEISFFIPYHFSFSQTVEVLEKELRNRPGIAREIQPVVLLDAFEPERLRLKVRFWVENVQGDIETTISNTRVYLHRALRDLGVPPYKEEQLVPTLNSQAPSPARESGTISKIHERQTNRATRKALSEEDIVTEEGISLLNEKNNASRKDFLPTKEKNVSSKEEQKSVSS